MTLPWSRGRRGLLWLCLLLVGVVAALGFRLGAAPPDPPSLTTEAQRKAVPYVFHPSVVSSDLVALKDPVQQCAQVVAAAVIVGFFMLRLREDAVQMQHIAAMMIAVVCIALCGEFELRLEQAADAVAAAIGSPAVSSAPLSPSASVSDVYATAPLMKRLWAVEEQWALDSSPMEDSADGTWVADGTDDEKHLAHGWNWAKPAQFAANGSSEQAWSAATAAERLGILHRLIMTVEAVVQGTQTAYYVAESLRLLLFHAGFAFAPLFMAGVWTTLFRVSSTRVLVGLVVIAFWPVAWALSNSCTDWMCHKLLLWMKDLCDAAFFPKPESGVSLTIAHCAPFFSWSVLSLAAVLTVALCLWAVGTLILCPWLLHRAFSGGVQAFRAA